MLRAGHTTFLARKGNKDQDIPGSRNIRRDGHEMLRDLHREKEISEDEERGSQDDLQQITDRFIEQAGSIGEEKEQELLEV